MPIKLQNARPGHISSHASETKACSESLALFQVQIDHLSVGLFVYMVRKSYMSTNTHIHNIHKKLIQWGGFSYRDYKEAFFPKTCYKLHSTDVSSNSGKILSEKQDLAINLSHGEQPCLCWRSKRGSSQTHLSTPLLTSPLQQGSRHVAKGKCHISETCMVGNLARLPLPLWSTTPRVIFNIPDCRETTAMWVCSPAPWMPKDPSSQLNSNVMQRAKAVWCPCL